MTEYKWINIDSERDLHLQWAELIDDIATARIVNDHVLINGHWLWARIVRTKPSNSIVSSWANFSGVGNMKNEHGRKLKKTPYYKRLFRI